MDFMWSNTEPDDVIFYNAESRRDVGSSSSSSSSCQLPSGVCQNNVTLALCLRWRKADVSST